MTDQSWQTARIDEIPRLGGRKTWIPVRKHFDIGAFGVNGWTADAEGDEIISEHAEEGTGHQELYVVTTGHATFTLDGEEVDGPAGTIVFLGETGTKRAAVAKEPGTTILAIGAKAGEAYEVSSWEATAEMWPLYEAGKYEEAAGVLRAGLERDPEDTGIHYNLACMEALMGHTDQAFEHLTQVAKDPRFKETAANDSDLDSLRDDPRFATLVGTS
jgi:tetratricopeptide (TPR) repeat protein